MNIVRIRVGSVCNVVMSLTLYAANTTILTENTIIVQTVHDTDEFIDRNMIIVKIIII